MGDGVVKQSPPMAPPVIAPVPVLRGNYSAQGGLAVWEGDWGMSEAAFLPGGQTSRFLYKSKKPINPDDDSQYPYSGLYDGHFFIQIAPGNPQKINETNLTLIFVKDCNDASRFKVGGHGTNKFGSFDLDGYLNLSKGSLEVTKIYRPIAPKPAKKAPVAKARAGGKRGAKAKAAGVVVAATGEVSSKLASEMPAAKASPTRASPKPVGKRTALAKLSQPIAAAAATVAPIGGVASPLQDLSSPRVRSERKRVAPSHLRDREDDSEETSHL